MFDWTFNRTGWGSRRVRRFARRSSGNEMSRRQTPLISEQNREALTRIAWLADHWQFDVYLVNAPLYDRLYEEADFRRYYEGTVRLVAGVVEVSPRFHYVMRTPQTSPIEQLQGVDHVTEGAAAVYSSARRCCG